MLQSMSSSKTFCSNKALNKYSENSIQLGLYFYNVNSRVHKKSKVTILHSEPSVPSQLRSKFSSPSDYLTILTGTCITIILILGMGTVGCTSCIYWSIYTVPIPGLMLDNRFFGCMWRWLVQSLYDLCLI